MTAANAHNSLLPETTKLRDGGRTTTPQIAPKLRPEIRQNGLPEAR